MWFMYTYVKFVRENNKFDFIMYLKKNQNSLCLVENFFESLFKQFLKPEKKGF